jgi:shikimate kinase
VLRDILPAFTGVVATGGGVVLRPENRLLLRERGLPVVWLTAPADTIRRRLAADPATASRRPALSGRDPLDEVADALAVREPLYREVADVVIDTSTEAPAAVAERILAWLGFESPEGAA